MNIQYVGQTLVLCPAFSCKGLDAQFSHLDKWGSSDDDGDDGAFPPLLPKVLVGLKRDHICATDF